MLSYSSSAFLNLYNEFKSYFEAFVLNHETEACFWGGKSTEFLTLASVQEPRL